MTAIDPRPPHRNLMIGVWIALLVAVGAAGYLLRSFMLKTYGVDAFDSACNINETFNCDKINTSVWGKLFGLPVTAFALPTYAAWAALAWLGSSADDRARISLRLLQVSAAEKRGIDGVWRAVSDYRAAMTGSGAWEDRRSRQARSWMWSEIEEGLAERFRDHPEIRAALAGLEGQVAAGDLTPTAAAQDLLARFLKGG